MATAQVTRKESSDPAVDAIANLPPNIAIIKMENDNIMMMASAHPRDLKEMKAALLEQLEAFPKQAEKMIYSKPIGWQMDQCRKCGWKIKRENKRIAPTKCCNRNCNSTDIELGGEKFARGLSIRSAEMLAETYKYNRIRAWVEVIDRDTVKVCASFVDYQNGCSRTDEIVVSKFYTDYQKVQQRIPDDRFYSVTLRAASSKVIREVVNRSVTASLKAWLEEEAEKTIDNNLDDATIKKMVDYFASKRVTVEMLEELIGRPQSMGWTKEDRKNLIGIKNSLESGEETVASIFGNRDEQNGQGDGSNGNKTEEKPKTPVTPTANAMNNPNLAGKKEPEAPKVDPAKQLNQCNFIRFKIESAPTLAEVDNLIGFADECVKKGDITAEHLQSLQSIIAKRKEELAPSQEVEKKDPEPEKQVENTVAQAAPTDDQIKAWKEYSGRIDECKNLLELEFLEADIKDAASKGTVHADQVGSLRPLIDLRKKDLARS